MRAEDEVARGAPSASPYRLNAGQHVSRAALLGFRTLSEDDPFAALERAETRLEAHARQRGEWRQRRARWRTIRAWGLGLLVLPAAGAAGFVVVLETAGGDLGGWSPRAATAFVIAAFVGPAVLAGAFARVLGRWWAFVVAVYAVLIEIVLVFAVAFVGLGYGPR